MKKILWFRHDLRIEDNEAFNKACNDGEVLPIFIYDEGYWKLETSSSFHLNFTKESLEELNNELISKYNSKITIFYGNTIEILNKLINQFKINGMAHITGGGLTENIPRSLPKHLAVEIYLNSWQLPEIFRWLQDNGNITQDDMLRIFNCGIGMALVVNEDISENVKSEIKNNAFECFDIGKVIKKDSESVIYS